MSAEIMEKASQLAEAIAESNELSAMRDAEIEMNNDLEAVKILEEFQDKQQELYTLQVNGSVIGDAEREAYEAIEARMQENPSIKKYIDASDNFENLMKSINLIITRAISGDDGCGCGCDSDCGSECGSGCNC